MKYSLFWTLLAASLLLNLNLRQIEASKLMLRPLNAREVYRILRDVGREDAVPEGRIVSQGIAAFTGFTLGLTKGIGGSILFDIITANVTGLLGTGVGASTTSSSNSSSTAQEICFNSRNARSLAEAEAVARQHRQLDESVDAGRSARDRRYEYLGVSDDIGDYSGIADYDNDYDDDSLSRASTGTSTTGTTGSATSPTGGTVTSSNGSTSSNDKPAITCIVIQK